MFCVLEWFGLSYPGSWISASFIKSIRFGCPFMTFTKSDKLLALSPTPTIYKIAQWIYCLKTIKSASKWQIFDKILINLCLLSTHLLFGRHKCIFPYSDYSVPICFMTDQFSLYFLKLIVNWHRLTIQARHIWNL